MILMPLEPLPSTWATLGLIFLLAAREWQAREHRLALNSALHEVRRPLQALLLTFEPGPAVSSPLPASMLGQAVTALAEMDREINGAVPATSRERLDVHGLIDSCARRWRSRASLAEASISVSWHGPEAEVFGDPGALSRALDNLVVNAIEHGGTRIEISAEPGPDEVEVEVIDSGSESQARCRDGSPAHVIERLCGRQRHGHGLAIVERAVRQHGGRFDLRLSPQGSRADIRLPLAGRGGPGS